VGPSPEKNLSYLANTAYQELAQLATDQAEPSTGPTESMDRILADWKPVQRLPQKIHPPSQVIAAKQPPAVSSVQHNVNVELDSDDDDDDDDLPAYDMSHDVKAPAKDAPRLRYLRDIMDHLGEAGDLSDPEACFSALPALCDKQLAHEDPTVVGDLLGVMLYAENRFDTTRWFSLRKGTYMKL
jgi:hypothetical protein